MSVFIDTNVPIYAAGSRHLYLRSCRRIIREIGEGEIAAVTDAEVLQEILYRYYHIGKKDFGGKVFDFFAALMSGKIYEVGEAEVSLARQLSEKYVFLSPRDLIHLAVMRINGVNEMISTDKGLRQVEDIRCHDPLTFKTASK